MTGYNITAGDVEAGLQHRMEVLVEKKSSTGWVWKAFGVLLLVALCIGGARLYVWYQLERSESTTQSGQTAAPRIMDPDVTTGEYQHIFIRMGTEMLGLRLFELIFVSFFSGAHSQLKEMSRRAKAAIHLVGDYDEDSQQPALEWKDGVGQAFALGGLRLHSNQIIIPEKGLYFVYSQVSFRVSCSNDVEGAWSSKPLSHRIWRSSDSIGKPVSLMSAVRSACQNVPEDGVRSGQGCYSTIYLGAVFHLDKGDKLQTETNQLPELETEEGKTYFGVFAL
uniref:Lymphotoxin-alpha n=1 Tax=Fundulus heteroclitus TaxID=8078 RepID=A0A3Q2R3A3_FUNHE